jgi:hypothetical protein
MALFIEQNLQAVRVEYTSSKGFIRGMEGARCASDPRRLSGKERAPSLDTPPAARILSIWAFFRNPSGLNQRREGVICRFGRLSEGPVEQEAEGIWVKDTGAGAGESGVRQARPPPQSLARARAGTNGGQEHSRRQIQEATG